MKFLSKFKVIIVAENSKQCKENEDLDEDLDKVFEMQAKIHHKCKMRDDPEEKQRKWNEKYSKK